MNVYFEPNTDELGGYTHYYSTKTWPIYPQALRFTTLVDLDKYLAAKQAFIQSIKIPESCDMCPISYDCQKKPHGMLCRSTWRKIWEYVK